MKEYRDDLRAALRATRAIDGARLRAEYAAPDQSFADVENVLLYNVGNASFRHLATAGLEVLRTTSPDARHHLTYSLTKEEPQPLSTGPVVGRVELDELPAAADKVSAWWAALRPRLSPGPTTLSGEFAIEVEIRRSRGFVSLVKPMLDGLISALQSHDGSGEDHVRAALRRHGDDESLWALLNEPPPVLGPRRRLVRAHRAGIAWNPADDLCARFRILPVEAGPALRAVVRSV